MNREDLIAMEGRPNVLKRWYGSYQARMAKDKAALEGAITAHPWLNGWNNWAIMLTIESTILLVTGHVFENVHREISQGFFFACGAFFGLAIGLIIIQQYVAEKMTEEAPQ